MRSVAAAVLKDVLAVAPGVLERVRQNGHAVEGARLVDAPRQEYRVRRAPRGVERDRAEGVARDATDQGGEGSGALGQIRNEKLNRESNRAVQVIVPAPWSPRRPPDRCSRTCESHTGVEDVQIGLFDFL